MIIKNDKKSLTDVDDLYKKPNIYIKKTQSKKPSKKPNKKENIIKTK